MSVSDLFRWLFGLCKNKFFYAYDRKVFKEIVNKKDIELLPLELDYN